MIERKYGRSTAVMLIGAQSYLEYQARVQYGNEGYSMVFQGFESVFPL